MGVKDHSPLYAWRLLGLLTFLNVFNFVDRQLIISFQLPIKADPDLKLDPYWKDVQIMLLTGYAFTIIYSVTGMVVGPIADRRHRPRLIALGLLIWSAMTAASGLARNFWEFALARMLVGIGEATLTPTAVAMLADVFPPRRRSFASGVYYIAVPSGVGLSVIIAGLEEEYLRIGWRDCFVCLGVIGIVLVAVLLLVKDPPRGGMDVETHPRYLALRRPASALVGEIARTLWSSPALVMTMVAGMLINIAVGSSQLDPSWLVEERHYAKNGAYLMLGFGLLLGGSLGNVAGGWLGDRFRKRWVGGRPLALFCLQLVLVPFTITYRLLPANSPLFPALLPVCCVMGSMLITIMYGPVYATVQELSPVGIRATMIAVLLIGLNIFGASLGSVLAAALSQRLGYTWGIFVTAQASLLALPLLLLAARRYATDLARLQSTKKENAR